MDYGYIYIIYNEIYNYYGENIFKIGKTKDITQRQSYYTTCYLEQVEIKILSVEVNNCTFAEKNIFELLKNKRIKKNREFFKLDNLKQAIEIIENEVNRINELEVEQIYEEKSNKKRLKTLITKTENKKQKEIKIANRIKELEELIDKNR